MKLFEYQAKEAFNKLGIPTPKGVVIDAMSEIDEAIQKIGLPCILKAQVLHGGRGKAGLIQIVKSVEEAREKVRAFLDSPHQVGKILVEQVIDIESEIYLSITIDPVSAQVLILACAEGGVDIEILAVQSPDKIIKEKVDITLGLMDFQCKDLAYRLGLEGNVFKQFTGIIKNLYRIFCQFDAELAEINPLFITKEGNAVAGDGKLNIDENSMFRQPNYVKTREYFETDVEYEADQEGIPYLQFDGDISLMCAGAGLTTTVYDLIHYAGGTVANYLEFGGPNYKKAVTAMELCLKNSSSVILIVTFGTIARADVIAEGIVEAIKKLKPDRPIVTCIRGTNEEKANEILKSAGLECILDTEEAVQKAVELAARRRAI